MLYTEQARDCNVTDTTLSLHELIPSMYVVCLRVCILGLVFVKEFIFKELVVVIFNALKINFQWLARTSGSGKGVGGRK